MPEPAIKPIRSTLPPALEALLTPVAYPHATSNIELRETHISWVVLTGSFAYKVKKPREARLHRRFDAAAAPVSV